MDDREKISKLIELHLELKGAAGQEPSADPEGREEDPLDGMGGLPSRKELFPSNRVKLTRIFYNTLFTLFFLLVAGLMIWGARMAP